ncbi:MAG: response regulator [Vicinamibacterales bacterium]
MLPGHVLIVEDDEATRDMLTTLIAGEGFIAVAAEDGLEALHLLRTVCHHAPGTPCLVLLDLSMPRLGGNAFRQAQLADPIVARIPVALMSGAADVDHWASELGAVATVPKPLNLDFLLQVVRSHCAPAPQA